MTEKEKQDERWNKLSQAERDGLMEAYKRTPDSCLFSKRYFGSHNLNPEPQIKTWEDIVKEYPDLAENLYNGIQMLAGVYEDCGISLLVKCDATLKIAKLIELGYGGMVSEEEWWNDNILKYYIRCNPHKDEPSIECVYHASVKYFIAFRTQQQAELFMSYESNRRLVKQYYMM